MWYVVVNERTWKAESNHNTARGAKIARAGFVRREAARVERDNDRVKRMGFGRVRPADNYVVMTRDEFDMGDTMVETTNLMTGATVLIRRSLKGGCCDPGTETYWSM